MAKCTTWLSLGEVMLLNVNSRGLYLHRVLLGLLLKRKWNWCWIDHLCAHVHWSGGVCGL
jgi:hypothetical protein